MEEPAEDPPPPPDPPALLEAAMGGVFSWPDKTQTADGTVVLWTSADPTEEPSSRLIEVKWAAILKAHLNENGTWPKTVAQYLSGKVNDAKRRGNRGAAAAQVC